MFCLTKQFDFGSTPNFTEDWLSVNSEKSDSNKRTTSFSDFSESSPTPRKRANSTYKQTCLFTFTT